MAMFTLEYWMDDGWYVGKLHEIPGVFSQGATLAELEENIKEAYALMLEDDADTILPSAGILSKPIEVSV